MELLKMSKFPRDAEKNNGVTAAGIAAYRGSVEMLQVLAEQGTDLYHSDSRGIGVLYMAIKGKKPEAISFLLARNLPIYMPLVPHRDNSPIFFAIREGYLAAVELICDRNTEELNYVLDSVNNNAIMYAVIV